MKLKVWRGLLVAVLAAGNIIAWGTVFLSYRAFFRAGGSLLQFSGCSVVNPLATPCFYGAIGFFVALVWAVSGSSYRYLRWFLLACTLFGWGNVAYEWFVIHKNSQLVGCGARTVTSVFQSSCLYGTIAFTLALIFTVWIYRKMSVQQV